MMIQPTKKELELLDKWKKTTDTKEKQKLEKEMREEFKKQDEKLKGCLFAH